MYNDKVKELFATKPNAGKMDNANAVGSVGNASCGDILEIYLRIENDVIQDASFLAYGCAAAFASSSQACEMIKGLSVEDALNVTDKQVIEKLGGLPAQKMHCSVLAEEAIRDAIKNWKKNI